MTKSTKVCDQAIAEVRRGIAELEACKVDDVIYAILKHGLAVCIDKTGRLYIGSAIHAAPAHEVSKILNGNILRNGENLEAIPLPRQVVLAMAIDMGHQAIAKFEAWKAERAAS